MSGTFPSSPEASSVRIRTIQPALVSEAQSFKRWARTRGAQRWAMVLSWPSMTKATFMPLFAFCMAQRGQYGTFQIVLPPPFNAPQGSWAGTPVVDGASQVGNAINIKGLTPSATGIAKAGDVFKMAGHSKVYMVTADANADGAGKAALAIEPKLVLSPADLEALTITAVPFTCALAQDINEFPGRAPSLFTFEVSIKEAY